MRAGSNTRLFKSVLACLMLALIAMSAAQNVLARGIDNSGKQLQRYIIEFQDPPLALYSGRQTQAANQLQSTGAIAHKGSEAAKLDMQAAPNRNYLEFIAGRQEDFAQEAGAMLGRKLKAVHRYRVATNGMAVDLTPAEAADLAQLPQVKSIRPDVLYRLETYAGPQWIGAGTIWSGASGFPEARGESVVVGVIDSGINWEHPSFADPSPDGYRYSNPMGERLGLCDDPEVRCNNKLIGVYDFVEDDPDTEEVEANTKGRDESGHGSLVSSIVAGNPLNVSIIGAVTGTLSGVAPRANLVMYRVCYGALFEGGCPNSAILAAIDQAITDGVDVISYSLGSVGPGGDPWRDIGSAAFLAARESGIFAATSAGNGGPHSGSITSPANAPWIVAVGSATHNGYFGNSVRNLVGGDTAPPGELAGASLTGGTGQLKIVHARDYGFALCGVGEAELEAACEDNQGLSNPWAGEKPFNGEIVVCDRGTYGRVEKGKNVLLAGAGGYILANTEEWGESLVADEHCLPASHIGKADGDKLRNWLASGSGHGGSISASVVSGSDLIADQVDAFSSRGPAAEPGDDVLKPNLIAPGSWSMGGILGAGAVGQEFLSLGGTSFASPHVAGAAALLKSIHSDWSPSQLASAIETTATPELATDRGIDVATALERGAGRPQLGEAANAGLYLNVTANQFRAANPSTGGDPGNLNLPGLVRATCLRNCSFSRIVKDQMGGGDWTATAMDFPAGAGVTVTPPTFSLANGGSQTLTVHVDLEEAGIVGDWVDGRVRLSAAGSPDLYLTVSVFADGGDLPASWSITDDRDGGWSEFELSGLVAMPDATFHGGGLQPAERTTAVLVEDPSNDDPYDGGSGVFTHWQPLPQGGLWLHAETLQSTAEDLDLYVGRDDNGNGVAEVFEELCSSITETDLEQCDLYDLPAGNYWILVQNWSGTNPGGDEVTLLSAGIAAGTGTLAASGPGIVESGESFTLRLSWDNLAALPGEEWLGAVGIGTQRDDPDNIGVIPVRFRRNAISAPSTFPLYDGVDHQLALDAGQVHDRLFIDVPPGATSLTVATDAFEMENNDGLELELRRLAFDEALVDPPFAVAPTGATVVGSDSGGSGVGPSVTVSGNSLQAGRWYAVLTNGNDAPAAVNVRADVAFGSTVLPIHQGLWEPSSRPGLGQGYEYNWGGSERALIWYSYEEGGQPTWYIAGSPATSGNIWGSDLYRVTNDGARQQLATVGRVSVTALAEDDQLFTFTLFGQSGTDRMMPISASTCPQVDGAPRSVTGLWYRGVDGLGGASVIVNESTQAQIHYLFDDSGRPRWLVAQEPDGQGSPTAEEMPMLQFSGYCAVCAETERPLPDTVGVLARQFDSELMGSWTLDYLFQSPLSGSAQRTDQIVKLTETLDCL